MSLSDQRVDPRRYQVIPRTLTFLFAQDRVLLLRLPPAAGPWGGRLNGVGGHIEPGESALASARRELLEETGLKPPELRLCGTIMIQTDSKTGIALYVFAGEAPDQPAISLDAGEPVWVSLDSLGQESVVEDLPQLVPRTVDAFRRRSPPFSGLYVAQPDGTVAITWTE